MGQAGKLDDFALAAGLYRAVRAAGVTIRSTIDCLIAAPCTRTPVGPVRP